MVDMLDAHQHLARLAAGAAGTRALERRVRLVVDGQPAGGVAFIVIAPVPLSA